jgi:hypothetical protein
MVSVEVETYLPLVRQRCGPSASPLDLVRGAAEVGTDLSRASDAVLEHYVREAYRAGFSWRLIGDRLGMTRQAARQRFGATVQPASGDGEVEIAPRLRECLDAARVEAGQDGREQTDTQYLLLGLLKIGVAAGALDRLGVSRERVRTAMEALYGPAEPVRDGAMPEFSADAERAIAASHTFVRERGLCYLATEHVLFCLATDPGSPVRRVLDRLDVPIAAVKRELAPCVPVRRRRRRR